ncbi:hypothetical protein [Mesorhizobium sp. L-8-3]|uniref:hypothetical protein n=1 Tax=Mesorhizobium sp. L-8-3 TaxID=2744522 RepID=UPI001926FB65|nr:hypothetical protein [Mesorhizobium sp. L-8-3]BCH25755.1 hypothetical protein MesoLjLb_55400 [Mesorhizobium sp. L-8-3]
MLDFQPWIERTFGAWTFREIVIALVVVAAALAAFDVARAFVPIPVFPTPDAGSSSAIRRWLDRDDPRGFLPGSALGSPGEDDGRFDIAWISGSPISIRKAPSEWRLMGKSGYEMTDVLAHYLVSMDGRPVRIQEYLLQGVRMGDVRRAVLFAAHQPEIDAYVVEANPVWMLNDLLQFTLSRQRASVLGLPGATRFDFAVMARLLRPHEVGFQLLAGALPVIRDRFALFGGLSPSPLPPFPQRKPAEHAQDGQMIGTWMNWLFPDIATLPIPEAAAGLRSYRNLMLMGDLGEEGLGMRLFAANLHTLAATGKPVIVFMPPLNPRLKLDASSVDYVRSMRAALDRQFAAAGAPNIVFRSDTVWAEPQPADYLDILHLRHGQGVIGLVVGLLEEKIGKTFAKRPLSDVYGAPERTTVGQKATP